MKKRYLWSRVVNYVELSLIFIVPLLVLLGVWGFRIYFLESGDEELIEATWSDYFYHSARAFIFEWDAPDGVKPWQLEVFRWLAPFSIFAGAMVLLKNVLQREWPRFKARWLISGHTIVCGLGARGSWICRQLSSEGKVVGIELNAESDFLAELPPGVIGIVGNAKDVGVVRDAGLAKAKRVVVVAGDDETNLAIAQEVAEVRGKSPTPEIVAAVEGYEARSYFAEKLWADKEQRIRVVGLRSYAFLRLAREIAESLATRLGPIPERAPIICVEASDSYQLELIRSLVMMAQISGDTRPVFHVCASSIEQRDRFNDHFPAAAMVGDFHWHVESAISQLRGKRLGEQVDAAVFAMANDSASLCAAESFQASIAAECEVYAFISDADDVLKLALKSNPTALNINVRSIYNVSDDDGAEDKNLFELCEEGARKIAQKYDEMYNEGGKVEPFIDKKIHDQESNRMAAMHAGVKRNFWNKRDEVADTVVMTHLCSCEHARWVAFHAMNGWDKQMPGSEKDANRRLHPDMIPFSELHEKDKEKDVSPVRWAIDKLV